MTDDTSAARATDKPTRRKPTALELALVAAAIDPVLSKQKPSKAVHLAEKLLRAAQDRIDCLFNEEEDEETAEEACDRQARESLFRGAVSISEAFHKWGPANGYKTEGHFAAALRKADLSYKTIDENWSAVEMTSESAVNKLDGWKKDHEQKRWRESKRKPQREISKKNTGILGVQNGNAEAKKGKSNDKSRSRKSKKRTGRSLL
jgi:hypothetical protein